MAARASTVAGAMPPVYEARNSARASEKWAVFFGLATLLLPPYFAIQYHELFPARVMPQLALDRSLPLVQPAVYVYMSAYLLSLLPLLLVRDVWTMRRMAFGFGWIACISSVLFFFWPTAIPPLPASSDASNPLLRWVVAVDTARNACPSLHASLAIYAALCCARLLRARWQRTAVWAWATAILASTLLTKKHVALDLLAGAALGFIAYASLFLAERSNASGSEALDATLAARAAVLRGREAELAALTTLNWRKRLREFICFSAIAAGGVSFTLVARAGRWPFPMRSFALLAGVALTAIALNAFVLLMHEGMHGILFARGGWNWAGSVVLGSAFLMSFTAYRVMHTRHHKYLGDPRDPDDYHNYVRHPAFVWALHFLRLTIGSLLYLALIPFLALRHGTPRERSRILAEYALLLAIYSAVLRLVPLATLAIAWFLPLLVVGTLTAMRGFTQHGITDAADPYIASRTILPHRAVRFLLLNENFHLEHHLFPEVPSYHLPALHQLIWPTLPRAVSDRGYLRFLAKFLRATPRMDASPIGFEQRAVGIKGGA
jgi:fatty acid desaturase/membrane-associated phospholipid phosphatase